jgi:hypothetical protein
MKKILVPVITAFAAILLPFFHQAQTTAMDFQGVDCNGNNVHLFSDLDAGKAVVLFYYMPNCGTCPPPAQQIQTMANTINSSHPGLVKAYAYPFQNSTTCSYSASWVTDNNLSLYTPMDSGAVQVAYYGGFGMPTVVLVGGANHDVLFVTQDYNSSDTTTIRDLILNTFTASTPESENIHALNVFPNPANDWLQLTFTNATENETVIELVDLSGKTVLLQEKETLPSGLVSKELNVSELKPGFYLLRITSGSSITQQEISIIR